MRRVDLLKIVPQWIGSANEIEKYEKSEIIQQFKIFSVYYGNSL